VNLDQTTQLSIFKMFLLALLYVVGVSTAEIYKGFNYGSTSSSGSPFTQSDFQNMFQVAANLQGTSNFTSARLYTMIQAGTTNSPIEAIPAAIAENTKLLLGLWSSAGDAQFANEMNALQATISEYGTTLEDIVIGISVGSEDLYRDSIMGIQSNAGIGVGPTIVVDYIQQVREAIAGTCLAGVPIGHVDTWTAWVNGTNAAVIGNCDWIGFDGYPYFQTTMANPIENAQSLFEQSYQATLEVAGNTSVWITETGWPLSGPTRYEALASVNNAKAYWNEVGCSLFGQVNVFWYTLWDDGSSPSFGIVGENLSSVPAFDLTCSS
jgi:glucan endo-1,3-beta-D-glucosidase